MGNGIACILNRKLNDNCIRFGGDSCRKAGSNEKWLENVIPYLLDLEMLLLKSSSRKNKQLSRIKYDYVEEIHSLAEVCVPYRKHKVGKWLHVHPNPPHTERCWSIPDITDGDVKVHWHPQQMRGHTLFQKVFAPFFFSTANSSLYRMQITRYFFIPLPLYS